ncbi:hypothetical protein [Lachnospira sp.]|jgi:hypothetical protein|uniref:hypothetical protein n=1 Tax=Lachnospira sp. TaxID=2049031 RepID=UPI002579A17B|nr:hypothetical protein [Lachnospira sp.]
MSVKKLFKDKYVGYHTFGLSLKEVSVGEKQENNPSEAPGENDEPGFDSGDVPP